MVKIKMTDDEGGVVSIERRFLYPNFLFGLIFQEGYVFGRILRRSIMQYKPFDQLGLLQPGSTQMTFPSALFQNNQISPQNTTQTDVILASGLSPADLHDVLYIPTAEPDVNAFPFLHGAIGVKPSYVRVYPRYPQNESFMGKWPSLNPPQPQNGDPFAYFDGVESPYDTPTDFRQLVIPPGLHMSFQFFLPPQYDQVQPLLNLRFAFYVSQLFDPIDGPDWQKNLVGMIATSKVRSTFLTVGSGEQPLSITRINMPVEAVSIEAAAALGGTPVAMGPPSSIPPAQGQSTFPRFRGVRGGI